MSDPHRPDDDSADPRWVPAVDMVRRTGARAFQIRYCEEEEPTVWMALAMHGVVGGRPVPNGGQETWTVGAGMSPTQALLNLCDNLIDGGQCQHCGRPSGFSPDFDVIQLDEEAGIEAICWYKFDPELGTFRRRCEGQTVPR